jgi:hypothetical protein
VSLTPPETPTPDLTMPVVGKDNEPVELLPGRHPERVAAFLFGGLAVVGIGVGSAFGALALSQQSSFNAHPTPAGASLGNQDAVVCDVAFGAAVIAGVTSLILFLDPPAHERAPDAEARRELLGRPHPQPPRCRRGFRASILTECRELKRTEADPTPIGARNRGDREPAWGVDRFMRSSGERRHRMELWCSRQSWV